MGTGRVFAVLLLAAGAACAQRSEGPQPPVVDPGGSGWAPSDAVVLFNGRDNTGWTTMEGAPSKCTVTGGVMSCRTGAGDTRRAEQFRDAQIHVEFNLVFHAPRCAPDGSLETPGSLTLHHNGVLIQDHVPVRARKCVADEGPLVLQDHGRYVGRKIATASGVSEGAPDTTVKFRNIWMRRLTR